MTDSEIFEKYFNGGNVSLPLLIKMRIGYKWTMTANTSYNYYYFTNNNENIIFEGQEYLASSFEYTPPDNMGGGASLRIAMADGIRNAGVSLVEIIESANTSDSSIEVVGVLAQNGQVERVKNYKNFIGNVSYDEKMEAVFSLREDDRLSMTFPPYKFDSETNKGNA